ncbi:hypothetical protein [Mesorhizobium sp. ES1-4]|uniref:hypothetical protein n=1 Tax=Mesorhizobium sp. ES1-4 TaxID=2876627 RepID=UPI001CCD5A49|nr:hypothetical protein [Mesorhizobium sp. ES1-4]MBZ9798721.1 hypothetical protein [Mesorhizobium sp. ES1-4]
MTQTREISHDEASDIISRLIWSAFRRDGQPFEPGKGLATHIPCRPDLDDDCLIQEYIRQQEAKERLPRYAAIFISTSYQDGSVLGDRLGLFADRDDVIAAMESLPQGSCKPNYCYVTDKWTGSVSNFEEAIGRLKEVNGAGNRWPSCISCRRRNRIARLPTYLSAPLPRTRPPAPAGASVHISIN